MRASDFGSWNETVAALPGAHILQTREWAQIKAQFGWQPEPFVWEQGGHPVAAALVLRRRLLPGLPWSVLYVPKGPLLDWAAAALRKRVLDDLEGYARRTGAVLLKVDPDVVLGTGIPGEEEATEDPVGAQVVRDLAARGWRFSPEQVQFRNTVWLDLTRSEEEILAAMKQKTRYNIRLAARKGVVVRVAEEGDLDLLYRMYAETAARDGFVIRPREYYLTVWRTLWAAGMAEPLIAEVEGEPVAAVVIFRFAGRAYYFYGMSTGRHRNKMPTYLLQWEAIRRARAAGCTVYDFWGAPEVFDERDPMWGVYRFKAGFRGQVVRTLGAWDYPARSALYTLFVRGVPALLALWRKMRMFGVRVTASRKVPPAPQKRSSGE